MKTSQQTDELFPASQPVAGTSGSRLPGYESCEGAHGSLYEEVEGENPDAGGQEAAPEDGGGVEGGPLLDGEQQASYRGCKRCCHTCMGAERLVLE